MFMFLILSDDFVGYEDFSLLLNLAVHVHLVDLVIAV